MASLKIDQLIEPRIMEDELMRQALTHRSAAGKHNERLEFLGDAVLDLLVADFLYNAFSDSTEGEMTRVRAYLVQGETLAEIAREIDLHKWVVLGEGEKKSKGHDKDSLLAGCLEAVFAAYYLLCGYQATAEMFVKLYGGRLDNLPRADALKDAKTRLQEVLQARQFALPIYETVYSDEHKFVVSCLIEQLNVHTEGQGSSKRKAEQEAAAAALDQLEHLSNG